MAILFSSDTHDDTSYRSFEWTFVYLRLSAAISKQNTLFFTFAESCSMHDYSGCVKKCVKEFSLCEKRKARIVEMNNRI